MNTTYNNNYQKYLKQGYFTVPLKDKNPNIAGAEWQNKTFDFDQSIGDNIGLILGQRSGVICLDLDVTNLKLKEKIQSIVNEVAPSRIIRHGNRDKLPSRFYQWNDEYSVDKKSPIKGDKNGIQLLSTGKQVVLPPSRHDKGYDFEWGDTSLLDVPREFLPVFPKDAWDKICEAFDNHYKNITVDQVEQSTDISDRGEFSKHGSHNTLKAMSCAMVAELTTIPEAVNKLIKKDKEINHDCMSFFKDKKYGKAWHHDPKTNAKRFYYEILTSINNQRKAKGLNLQLPTDVEITDIKDVSFKPVAKVRKKYPHFRGVGQEMFEYIYDQSPVPRSRLAVASVLSLGSIILGNRVRMGNIYPNLYSLMVAPSGYGKDFPLKFPKKVLGRSGYTELIGQSHPASDTGIMLNLPNQPVRIDCVDEADTLFGAISSKQNAYSTKMADVYATLYTSTGHYFEGKTIATQKGKVVGNCHSPYVTMLAAMTPGAFERSFTSETIEKGLGARFLYFIDKEKKRSKPIIQEKEIPKTIIDFCKRWRNLKIAGKEVIVDGEIPRPIVQDIEVSDCARYELLAAHEFIEDMKEKAKDGKMMAILNRAYVNIVKLAIIDCAFCNPYKTSLVLKKDNIVWALGFFGVYAEEMKEFVDDSVSETQDERDALKIQNAIKTSGENGISSSKLYRRTRSIGAHKRKAILKDLIESGVVLEAQSKPEGSGRPRKIYFFTGY